LVDALLAGSENPGELEERLRSVIAELSHAGNIIVFIPLFLPLRAVSDGRHKKSCYHKG